MQHSSVDEVLAYLVAKKLSGELKTIVAIKEYYVNNASPSDIAAKLGVSKLRVRGWLQMVKEKCGNSHIRAQKVIAAALPYILRVSTIVLKVNGSAYCILCDLKMKAGPDVLYWHVKSKHRELVQEIVKLIKRELRWN